MNDGTAEIQIHFLIFGTYKCSSHWPPSLLEMQKYFLIRILQNHFLKSNQYHVNHFKYTGYWSLFSKDHFKIMFIHIHLICPLKKKKKTKKLWTSLVVQWMRIHLPMRGTLVWPLVQEDSTSLGVTKSVHLPYWARALQLPTLCAGSTEACKPTACTPEQDKPSQWQSLH